jgi:hypothetical protein
MTKRPVASNTSKLGEDETKLQSTMSGSKDTELNEFAVTPTKRDRELPEVTTVTPVPKLPKALRKSRLSQLLLLFAFIC